MMKLRCTYDGRELLILGLSHDFSVMLFARLLDGASPRLRALFTGA